MTEMADITQGQMDRMKEAVDHNRKAYDEVEKSLRDNPNLSEQGRSRAITEKFEQAQRKHEALAGKYYELKDKQKNDMHETLFEPRQTISQTDAQREANSRRYHQYVLDADSRLTVDENGGFNERDLIRYMEVARLSGNQEAERAAFWVAHSRGAPTAVREYLDKHPEANESYHRYQQMDQAARQPSAAQMFSNLWELVGPKRPDELRDRRNVGEGPLRDIFSGGRR